MRSAAIAALLVVALLAGAGVGYLVGNGGQRTTTLTSTATRIPGNGGCAGTPVEFQAIPVDFTHMPVLLMRPGTTAVVCVVYQDGWNGNASQFSYWAGDFQNGYSFLPTSIEKATCTSTPQSSGCFYNDSHSFYVEAYPDPLKPEASVANVTVVYSVYALPNSTGFYDRTFIYSCESPRLAVGYSSEQVNPSDFATIFEHSCFNAPYVPILIAVSGMNVTYVSINTAGK